MIIRISRSGVHGVHEEWELDSNVLTKEEKEFLYSAAETIKNNKKKKAPKNRHYACYTYESMLIMEVPEPDSESVIWHWHFNTQNKDSTTELAKSLYTLCQMKGYQNRTPQVYRPPV